MKTFLFSINFLILTLTVLPLSLCSNDDDNPSENVEDFEPVTIDLSDVIVAVDDTAFSVDGFMFNIFRANSVSGYGSIILASPQNGNPSMLELDLNNVEGFSRITLSISDSGGGTTVSLWNDDVLIQENDNIPLGVVGDNFFSDVVFELDNQQIDLIRITSIEGFVKSITLE